MIQARGLVPEHLGIAEILQSEIDHRVARVLRPGAAAIVAGGEVLRLPVVAVSGVDGDEAGTIAALGRQGRWSCRDRRRRCRRRS